MNSSEKQFSTLQVREGKFYLRRDGEVVKAKQFSPSLGWAVGPFFYSSDGTGKSLLRSLELIAEVPETQAEEREYRIRREILNLDAREWISFDKTFGDGATSQVTVSGWLAAGIERNGSLLSAKFNDEEAAFALALSGHAEVPEPKPPELSGKSPEYGGKSLEFCAEGTETADCCECGKRFNRVGQDIYCGDCTEVPEPATEAIQVQFGTGRIAMSNFNDGDGHYGVILKDTGELHEVGSEVKEPPSIHYPQLGEIYLRFANRASVEALRKSLAEIAECFPPAPITAKPNKAQEPGETEQATLELDATWERIPVGAKLQAGDVGEGYERFYPKRASELKEGDQWRRFTDTNWLSHRDCANALQGDEYCDLDSYIYRRRTQPSAEYRAFASAEEAKVLFGRVLRYKLEPHHYVVIGAVSSHMVRGNFPNTGALEFDKLFNGYEFDDDGSPCGVPCGVEEAKR